ncbi:MAG: hypothetical protein ACE5DO_13770, partial [Desulfobacterales bacterium]
WDYENIMGGTDLHENYVFLTKSHDHASTKAIWVVKEYNPDEYHVQFYKVEPEEKIGVIEVKCIRLNRSRTKVQISYEYIALSEKGNQFIERFTASEYEGFIAEWETLLEKYFERIS